MMDRSVHEVEKGLEIPTAGVLGELQHEQLVEEIPAAESRRVLLKIDLVVMPLIVVAMTLAFLDKNALAYAAIFGLRTDTHLVGQQYSWLGSIFYFGYLAMQFPNLWLITKFPIGIYSGGCLIAWGACLCLLAACHNFAGLAVVRLFLGVFEAALLPCLLLVNTRWYRREEQPLRTAFWYNTFAGVFGGILSYAIGHIHGSLSTWKYIFLIYGSVTMLVGTVVIFALPNSPATAWFLSAEEKKIAMLRVTENQTGLGAIIVHVVDPTTQRNVSLAGVYIMGFYNVPWVLALSLQTSNTGGTTKKSFVSISVAVFYAVGNIIGPQFFLSSQSPHYPLGIGAMLCCFAIMAVTGVCYFVACLVSNKHRDRVHGAQVEGWSGRVTAGLEADIDDLTDRENPHFRYTY
ncbi:major facilitator superfamily domain-containing protein [Aspergillus heterothallicus]